VGLKETLKAVEKTLAAKKNDLVVFVVHDKDHMESSS